MPKRVLPLTDLTVKKLKATGKVQKLFDGGGLYLRVSPLGCKTWYFNYLHPITKKRIDMRLGVYPALSLSTAREWQRAYRSLVAEGVDPKDHIEDTRQKYLDEYENTFDKMAYLWLEEKPHKGSEGHHHDTIRRLENHLLPKLGKTPVKKITAKAVKLVLKPLEKKNKLELVKRLCRDMNNVMFFAMNHDALERNPLAYLHKQFRKPIPQNHPYIDESELPEFFSLLNDASSDDVTKYFIELKLHLMTRSQDLASSRWSAVNWEKRILTIPGNQMKGNKEFLTQKQIDEKYTHVIPLSDVVINILQKLRAITGNSEFLFNSLRAAAGHINYQSGNKAIKEMGYEGKLVAHGLRDTASTALHDAGYPEQWIDKALSHRVGNEVSRSYNHAKYIELRRDMMNWWSDKIESAKQQSLKDIV
ncbi:tyrosine-type recombinase/integrase [Photobacterium sanctipauli]|nr:integrase arm-type DNA-binding domain-containing protein [Photobacterium sanctipauli]